ncbi:hypothetical protein CVT26_002123 [Gymnopilus dilepis]|uniref:Protein CPL1-like domain-containing protein n=1 Tax=Gymnopilus dilepis TaxID=231916 RepID=A0A409VBP6_9AGAR|nr:hypothetical protein CVT26_002123 [Gymnopilus dilepis]
MQLKVVLSVLAALLPLAASTSVSSGSKSCKSSEFWYEERSCCLPHGGPSNPPSPPKGTQCPPTSHYWDDHQSCCVPRNPPPPNCPPPQCNKGWEWYSSLHQCKPIPTPSSTPPTPKPSSKPYGGNPYGGNPSGGSPHGGSPSGGNPYGGGSSGGSPHGGSPSGGSPYGGSPSGGNPHGGSSSGGNNHYNNNWKRSHKSRVASPCPAGLDACPIPGALTNDYECLDTSSELESCGGCASLGQGQDCTAISNAWNVGCDRGSCVVFTCSGGYKIGPDGKSCVPL